MEYLRIALQVIVGLGILNVWLIRSRRSTSYRGGEAETLREEFTAYGLPFWFMCLIGVLKIGLAVTLLLAIFPKASVPARPAAIGLGLLMVGAFVMHLKIKDPVKRSFPAIAVLTMCCAIALLP